MAKLGWNARVRISEAFAGGGSLPSEKIESRAVVIEAPWPEGLSGVDDLAQRIRQSDPAVVGRIHDGGLWIDLRTISKDEHAIVIRAMKAVMGRDGQHGDVRPH
jgi:L-seryl-tRNA(Ser) seleniumtransferase